MKLKKFKLGLNIYTELIYVCINCSDEMPLENSWHDTTEGEYILDEYDDICETKHIK